MATRVLKPLPAAAAIISLALMFFIPSHLADSIALIRLQHDPEGLARADDSGIHFTYGSAR
jgi:hypothetical protein